MNKLYLLTIKKFNGEVKEILHSAKSKPTVGATVDFKDGARGEIIKSKRKRAKITKNRSK